MFRCAPMARIFSGGCGGPCGQLAEQLGSSPRAVGSAVGRNPLSLLIPCHRVVGADGSLTGYAGGIERKKALLTLEAKGERA